MAALNILIAFSPQRFSRSQTVAADMNHVKILPSFVIQYRSWNSYAPHNDDSVNYGPHIRWLSYRLQNYNIILNNLILNNIILYNTGCPTRYRTRHFFNSFTTNEDIATKLEASLPHFVRNVKEYNVLLFKFRCNIFIGVRIIKEMPGSVASMTPCIIIPLCYNCLHYSVQ